MFEGLNRNQTTSAYVSQRLSNGRDDRTLQEKQSSDAWLRGKLGVQQANRIIATIDDLKSRR